MTHSTTSTAQLASGTQQRVVRRVRHVLRLPKCVSDETVFSVAGRSSVWAYAELYVAFEDLETEIIKALPKWVRRLLPSKAHGRRAAAGYAADVGDYVLATKYDDGDPCDHFCVGFVTGYTHHNRYLIADSEGQQQRANGFRRAERITEKEGRQLIERFPEISDRPGPSLWDHLAQIRGEQEFV